MGTLSLLLLDCQREGERPVAMVTLQVPQIQERKFDIVQ